MGEHGLAVWLGFTGLVVTLLVLDLGVLNRRSHVLSFKEATNWSLGLVAIALTFGMFLWWLEGSQSALEYYTGYLIELSLSVDNLFVFILIFNYFGVPSEAQPKVLKWGILGAIVMRFLMIGLGALLLERFEWIIYVFGGILFLTGLRMLARTVPVPRSLRVSRPERRSSRRAQALQTPEFVREGHSGAASGC